MANKIDDISYALYEGISEIVRKLLKSSNYAVITDVMVTANNNDGTYTVQYSGKSYNVPLYGNNTITVNKTAKLFIPGNNLSRAFIM